MWELCGRFRKESSCQEDMGKFGSLVGVES